MVTVIRCSCWEEFFERARGDEEGRVVGLRLYRGQRDPNWKLSSGFERDLEKQLQSRQRLARSLEEEATSTDLTDYVQETDWFLRDRYLDRFKASVAGVPGTARDPLDEDGWWAVARHHGLLTPLLDWTHSPYVAAFFAFTDHVAALYPGFLSGTASLLERNDVGAKTIAVWSLALADEDLERRGEFEFIGTSGGFLQRQRAQKGEFTKLTHPRHIDLASYLRERGKEHYLEKIEIPAIEYGKALYDLSLMNIRFEVLFPDTQGAVWEANTRPLLSKIEGQGQVVKISYKV